MKYPGRFYFLFATLVCLTRAQDSNDGCITCYLGDLFGDYILPATGRLFAPDLPSNPGATNPAPGFVEPQTDPEEQRSTDRGRVSLIKPISSLVLSASQIQSAILMLLLWVVYCLFIGLCEMIVKSDNYRI